ncbi:MAG TPA: hypothetical protein VEY70_07940 [Metabacillus sp.]|nr:hypothetical protein [Metabacillus sp.]
MNNFNFLISLMRGNRNRRFFNMFGNRRPNNGSMILLSLLSLTTLGVIGSRNTGWAKKIQEGYNNLRNNSRRPIQNPVNFATEFAEEVTPEMFNKNNNNQ